MKLTFLYFFLIIGSAAFSQKGLTINSKETILKSKDTLRINQDLRMALVIGNAEYDPALKNPANDASNFATLLNRYGFTVRLKTNSNNEEMYQSINSFADSIKEKRGVALFYFSGHGLQYNNKNFLIPINSSLHTLDDVLQQTICLDTLLAKISYSTQSLNIIILDACRNSPFYDALQNLPKGLTYSLNKVKNTLIFFATSANDVAEDGHGNNSPFTEALLEVVNENENIELMQLVKQVVRKVEAKTNDRQTPQYVGTIKDDFYFKKKKENIRPNFHYLGVGIDDYASGKNLFSKKDARDLARLFKNAFGTKGSMIDSLINNNATYYNINSTIERFKQNAKEGDIILFYFNGKVISSPQGLFLMPYDGDFNNPVLKGISEKQLISFLADLPCKTLFFLDGQSDSSSAALQLLKTLNKPSNNVVVVYSTNSDMALESQNSVNGLLTYCIMEYFQNNPPSLNVESLCDYLIKRSSQISQRDYLKVAYPLGWKNFTFLQKSN